MLLGRLCLRRLAVVGVTVVVVITPMVIDPVGPAGATPFHNYALDYNGGATSGILAIQQTRYDAPPSGIPAGTYCTTPFAPTANPMFQSEWVNQNSSGTDWVELGTGHQCSGFEFWYAGDGNNGTWNAQWTEPISGSDKHTFYLFRNGSGTGATWHWEIDNTVENSWVSNWSGVLELAGLESYDSGAVSTYQISALSYYTSTNTTWRAFSSDSWSEDSAMCVHLTSETSANVGENVTNMGTCT